MSERAGAGLSLTSSEPILAVADVPAAAEFYREVLGFESQWLWGDPPDFGGVRWGKVHVMLCLAPELARKVEGHQHSFLCEDIDGLRERHRATGAPVISEIENKPWGIREYTVRNLNGYHLRFGGPMTYVPSGTVRTPPDFIRIVERPARVEEFLAVAGAVGFEYSDETAALALKNSIGGVVAMDTREAGKERVAGALRVVGDGVRFFYIQDMSVLPEFQHQGIGSAMMESIMRWVRGTARKGAFIGLFTGKPAFYEPYGFEGGYGMSVYL